MNRFLKSIHMIVGAATFVAFLGTGAYMLGNFPGLYQDTEIIRYQFRANHIYIFFSALLNIVAGLSAVPADGSRTRMLQTAGSVLLLLGPLVLLAAFFVEPPRASEDRPVTFFGIVFCLSGVALHALDAFRRRKQGSLV